MILYRAMSFEEYQKTIQNNELSFDNNHHNYKWFTDNFKFLKNRVQDGTFCTKNRNDYKIVLKFNFNDVDVNKFRKLNKFEFMTNKENNPIPISYENISKTIYIKK
jgi:hypothetical protein